MKKILEGIFNNKNTTVTGIGLIVATIGKFLQDKDTASLAMGIITGLGLIFAKDGHQ